MINKPDEKQKMPRLFVLWDQIVNGTEQDKKEVGKWQ